MSPPEGCHPAFFTYRPRLSTILYKFAHNFFPSGVTPWRVSPGAVRPPPPSSDATVLDIFTAACSRGALNEGCAFSVVPVAVFSVSVTVAVVNIEVTSSDII